MNSKLEWLRVVISKNIFSPLIVKRLSQYCVTRLLCIVMKYVLANRHAHSNNYFVNYVHNRKMQKRAN